MIPLDRRRHWVTVALFALPMVLLSALLAALILAAGAQLQDQGSQTQQHVRQSLALIGRVSQLGADMLRAQRHLDDALHQARGAPLNVRQASVLAQELREQLARLSLEHAWLEHQLLAYADFRGGAALLSTQREHQDTLLAAARIADTDPATALHLLSRASEQLAQFGELQRQLAQHISARYQAQLALMADTRRLSLAALQGLSLVGLLLINIAWLALVLWFTRQLGVVSAVMGQLAGGRCAASTAEAGPSTLPVHPSEFEPDARPGLDERLREALEAMARSRVGLVRGLARAALAHDRSLQERRRAIELMRQHRQLLKALINSIPDLIWLKDRQGHYLLANPRFEQLVGLPEAQILGRTDAELFPQQAAFFREHDLQAAAAGRPTVHEEWLTFASDGRRARVETIKTPVYTPDGELLGILGIARDITATRQAQERLERSEAQLRQAQVVANIGHWEVDLRTDTLTWSDHTWTLFGLNPAEHRLDLALFFSRLHPDDTAHLAHVWQTSVLSPGVNQYEVEHRILVNGTVRWVIERACIDRDAQGKAVRALGTVQDVTERKLADLAYRESQSLIRAVFDHVSEAIDIIDPQTLAFVHFNRAGPALLGYSEDEYRQLGLPGIIRADSQPHLRARLQQLLAQDQPAQIEGVHRHRDGHELTVAITAKRIQVGERTLILGVWRDITALKATERELAAHRQHLEALVAERTQQTLQALERAEQSQQALQRKEAELRLLMDSTNEGLFGLDGDGTITFANPAAARMLGYADASELVGRKAHHTLHHRHADGSPRPAEDCPITRSIASGQPCTVDEDLFWRNDGSSFPVLYSSAPLRQDGRTRGAVVAFQDISARKQAEWALREQAAFTRNLLNAIPNPVYFKDTQLRYLGCNPAFESLLGLSAERVIGKTALDLYPGPQGQWFMEQDRALLASGGQQVVETVLPTTRGPRTMAVHRCVFHDAQGLPAGIAGVMLDVTDIRAAQHQAEAASRAKTTLLATISHEIRTPLNAILGLTHLLQRQSTDAHQRQQLDHIHHAASHLLAVLNDVLDLSKIEADRFSPEPTDFDPTTLIDRCLALFADKAQAKGLSLHRELQPLPPQLHADERRLEQILLNLLSNALKFTDSGHITVRAHLIPAAAAQGAEPHCPCLYLEVQDTGVGLSPEQQAQIFEPFVQADPSTTRRHGGTGLGLAISHRLAQLLGGRIGVQSQPGQGSTFWVQLPVRTPTPAPQSSPPAPSEPPPEPPAAADTDALLRALQALGPQRVLLAEDHPLNRAVLTDLLDGLHWTIDTAGDGQQALTLAEAHPYRLILLDIHMPVLDGLQAAPRIRALPQHAHTPILALTANAFDHDHRVATAAGIDELLAKPLLPATLYAALLRWLRPPTEPLSTPLAPVPSDAPISVAPSATQASANVHFDPQTQATPPAEDPCLSALRAIPGLDLDAALAHADQRPCRLLHWLRRFADEQSPAPVPSAPGAGAVLHQWAHRLQSAAATVGLLALSQNASALQAAVRTGQPTETLLQSLSADLATLRPRLLALPTPSTPPPTDTAGPPPPTELLAAVQTLINWLAQDDARVIAYWQTLAAPLAAAPASLSPLASAIDRALKAFNLPEALAHARALQQALQQSPPPPADAPSPGGAA